MGVDRVMNYAFELASKRKGKLASATKSNGIIHTMTFWDNRFEELGKKYPNIEQSKYHIDILCAQFVQHPDWFDVVVASNLFGDILSDLGPAVVGGLGIAPGANINPEKAFPSMFEPVHGSAPDIAGKNIANPMASFWTAAMMLEHLGEDHAAEILMLAIEGVTGQRKILTRDLGGTATTTEVTEEIIRQIEQL
jgi:tartrate dehydrogenase/decarboxylase/D-malate dehydrogenase